MAITVSKNYPYRFMAKGVAALLLIIAGDVLFFQTDQGGGNLGVFAGIWLGLVLLVRRPIWRDTRALLAALLAAAFASALVLDPSFLAWCLFCLTLTMASLLPDTAAFDDGWRWFQRLFVHGARSSIAPLIDLLKLRRTSRFSPAILRGHLPNLILPVIGGIIILALFSDANPIIGEAVAALRLPWPTGANIGRLILWGLIFFGVWSSFRPKTFTKLIPTFDGTGDLAILGVTRTSVLLSLILFNALFLLQNGLDIAYLWGGKGLPAGMTVAEYAHRGAYPLIVTALLAALFVIVTLRPGSTTATTPLIRWLVILWIGQNIFLVASSMLRTVDYVEIYSLTQLRIYALVWMGLVATGLLLICWRMLKGRKASWLINSNLIAVGMVLGALCFIDCGAIAAKWNIAHARETGGKGTSLDLCYLNELGSSALLPLVDLERRKLDPSFAGRVRQVRQMVMADMIDARADGYWTLRDNARLVRAEGMLGKDAQKGFVPGRHDCNGLVTPKAMTPAFEDIDTPPLPSVPPAPIQSQTLTATPKQ
jgi:Domain of unknown function (DUF4173)